jgi:serine/threonine protein phosphatase PrpC
MENHEFSDESAIQSPEQLLEYADNQVHTLVLQPNLCLLCDDLGLEITAYRGAYLGVHYFDVQIFRRSPFDHSSQQDNNQKGKAGILRIDRHDGELAKELTIRQQLNGHRMIAPLIWQQQLESLTFDLNEFSGLSTNSESNQPDELDLANDVSVTQAITEELPIVSDEFLEEVYLEQPANQIVIADALICLSYLPDTDITLAAWLKQTKSFEEVLSITIQFCQIATYLYKHGWGLAQINPQLIANSRPIALYDLTGVFAIGSDRKGLAGNYCAPELAIGCKIDEQVSSYLIGSLLYQAIHHHLPQGNINSDESIDPFPFIKPIPGIYQLLNACLSANGDRPVLSQILNLLVEVQQSSKRDHILWDIAGKSTVGLSLTRWQNEDSYGVREQFLTSEDKPFILGVLADGMGGMEKGEVASKMAVKELINAPISQTCKGIAAWNGWLTSLVQKANYEIVRAIHNGGTTLSAVLAVGKELAIAHIGDSRIYLIRKGIICQISEDHSLVSALLAMGQINYEESLAHPDRNILTRSLGSKANLNPDQIQTLQSFGKDYILSLENGDILLICSDGVWDLLNPSELCQIFTEHLSIASAVTEVINSVLSRGANDNATILAMSCRIESSDYCS